MTWRPQAGPARHNAALPSPRRARRSMSERPLDATAAAEGRAVAQRAPLSSLGTLAALPEPLLELIVTLLPLDARACLAATCRRFRAMAEAPALWRVLDFGTLLQRGPGVSATPPQVAALTQLLARAAAHGGPCELRLLPAAPRPAVACGCATPWAGEGPCLACEEIAQRCGPPLCRVLAGRGLVAALRDSGAGAHVLRLVAGTAHAFGPTDAAALAAACPRLCGGEVVLLEPNNFRRHIWGPAPPWPVQARREVPLPAGVLTQRVDRAVGHVRHDGSLVMAHAKEAYRPEDVTLGAARRAAADALGTVPTTSLVLASCALHTAAPVLAMLREAPFAALTRVNLRGNRIADGAELWRELGRMPLLQALDVSNNPLRRDGAAALAEGVLLRAGGAGGGDAMAAAAHASPLLRLEANSCELCDGGVAELARALPHLAALGVRRNYMGDGGADAITHQLQLCAPAPLRALDMADNHVGAAAVAALAAALGAGCAPELASLDMHGSAARDVGAEALAAAMRSGNLSRLRMLALGNNVIGSAGAEALQAAAGACPELRAARGGKLDLHDNPWCREAAQRAAVAAAEAAAAAEAEGEAMAGLQLGARGME